ncbi:TraR/DksA C4-type zinc finger protein [Bacteriovorax sp. DB6_IX]|uniref:TraR/DksA family transcriptional regulator n=1 Tax=Bacteriovorax sp. DB6_IX TaxID=1353530 RepID=UPI00038A0E84|nr:TraR/DksA C4-type zinc finger protein [Bacteriovorax sp. DB6_IX]EQC50445.1 putative RNA polymerase-binding protein DksA [Bacteriovorax sp. DB6_IX]
MNTTDLKHFEILFGTMKEQLLAKAKLEGGDLEALRNGDIIDQTTNERDAQLLLKLQGRDRFFLKKVNHALEKIASGTFGECEECGEDITMKRLLARPIATQCIHCKEEQEREEGQVRYSKRSHTNGKGILNTSSQNIVSFPGDNNATEKDANVVNLSKFTRNLEEGALSS